MFRSLGKLGFVLFRKFGQCKSPRFQGVLLGVGVFQSKVCRPIYRQEFNKKSECCQYGKLNWTCGLWWVATLPISLLSLGDVVDSPISSLLSPSSFFSYISRVSPLLPPFSFSFFISFSIILFSCCCSTSNQSP